VRIAGLLRPGEWCTYGDISTAARGDARAARAVGRATASHPAFPAAHRVLRSGGAIAEEWGMEAGLGPAECRRRLEAEGVSFTADGRAGPGFRVTWDELVLRDGASGSGAHRRPPVRSGRRPPGDRR
jgi:alkylated DNA nucleotide flippase Atl1